MRALYQSVTIYRTPSRTSSLAIRDEMKFGHWGYSFERTVAVGIELASTDTAEL
jgi:hypothetical protein